MTPDLLEDIYQTFEKHGIDRSKLVPVIIDGELKEIYHIDLAENLYVGEDAFQRDKDDLKNGKMVQKATYRTHLLRVNGIPFESIFKFAYAFFKSKQLVDEWKAAEFV